MTDNLVSKLEALQAAADEALDELGSLEAAMHDAEATAARLAAGLRTAEAGYDLIQAKLRKAERELGYRDGKNGGATDVDFSAYRAYAEGYAEGLRARYGLLQDAATAAAVRADRAGAAEKANPCVGTRRDLAEALEDLDLARGRLEALEARLADPNEALLAALRASAL
jgi:hypothetical protein